MRRIVTLLLTILSMPVAKAGDGEYAVAKIPPFLLANAHVVKRMETVRFEYIHAGESWLHTKYALTILDEYGEGAAELRELYDDFRQIKNIEGVLFDKNGVELKRLRNKDISSMSASGNDLADDNHIKIHRFYYKNYPYTIQYEVDIRFNGSYNFPTWLPREAEDLSVEQSIFSIEAPEAYLIRYKALNIDQDPLVSQQKGRKSYTWAVKNLTAVQIAFGSPSWYEFNPVVFTAPTVFSLGKYQGDMSSWEQFGNFFYQLNQGRDMLPQKVKETVHALTDTILHQDDKVEKLYAYLQHNTRYVSIQLGIGGLQPFDATYVSTLAYGDCKALVNYMGALLKEAGIPSYYCLIYGGTRAGYFSADFPDDYFNHVILCVPLNSDTLWLECTNQFIPAGYLGEFTSNRYALMITPQGGRLVRTPEYGLSGNCIKRQVSAVLDNEGNLELRQVGSYKGITSDRYYSVIHESSLSRVKELLEEEVDLSSFSIDSFSYTEIRSRNPQVNEYLGLSVNDYATVSGKRIFIIPNILARSETRPVANENRQLDIDLGNGWAETDSIEFDLPGKFQAESIPAPSVISSKFGSYSVKVQLAGSKLFYFRHFEVKGGQFPSSDYTELVNFFDEVYRKDRDKVVLIR
jgi:hypothetical protein